MPQSRRGSRQTRSTCQPYTDAYLRKAFPSEPQKRRAAAASMQAVCYMRRRDVRAARGMVLRDGPIATFPTQRTHARYRQRHLAAPPRTRKLAGRAAHHNCTAIGRRLAVRPAHFSRTCIPDFFEYFFGASFGCCVGVIRLTGAGAYWPSSEVFFHLPLVCKNQRTGSTAKPSAFASSRCDPSKERSVSQPMSRALATWRMSIAPKPFSLLWCWLKRLAAG
jgi:hypothetical protein